MYWQQPAEVDITRTILGLFLKLKTLIDVTLKAHKLPAYNMPSFQTSFSQGHEQTVKVFQN